MGIVYLMVVVSEGDGIFLGNVLLMGGLVGGDGENKVIISIKISVVNFFLVVL